MTTPLVERLTQQLKDTGAKDPEGMARAILLDRGHINKDGSLTDSGRKREAMGAEGRAIDRAVRSTGHDAKAFVYSSKTNRATLKKGK